MSGDQPFASHEGVVLLLLMAVGFVAVPWLLVRAVRALLRARTGWTAAKASAPAAALAWAATAATYTWGLLHLFAADDYDQSTACNAAVGRRLVGYEPSWIPLEFGCRTADGGVVPVIVPSYVNPVLAVLAVCAVLLTVFVIVRRKEEYK
ncbi:hypothetical protein [Kitasatospora sp. NBC_00458]|uniref:hypothetical protein n=1 Tax=Kitasatospora sp. NBC_00458 TaxID=2903568 RepID=UPI002E16DBDA